MFGRELVNFRELFGFKTIYGAIVIGAKDMEIAAEWYCGLFGLVAERMGNPVHQIELGYNPGDSNLIPLITIIPIPEGRAEAAVAQRPILFTRKLKKVRELLISKGIAVSPIQSDSGGNHFFHFQDSEGNKIEMCLEPGLTVD